jgi:hypothetical protein
VADKIEKIRVENNIEKWHVVGTPVPPSQCTMLTVFKNTLTGWPCFPRRFSPS